MKSIEINVPKKLIKEVLSHPESYGDFVVILNNEMYTDVYQRENGEYITITNDEELIRYLNRQGNKKE